MRRFSIEVLIDLDIWYNHHLSGKFIEKKIFSYYFKKEYPLRYYSRGFDKPAVKWRDGSCFWCLDDERHRVGKPAAIYSNGDVGYWVNGKRVK